MPSTRPRAAATQPGRIDGPLQESAQPSSAAEQQTRRDLAACYRLVAHFGMDDSIYTHISARVPGEEGAFLINPYGHLFRDITPESLVKVGMDGHPVAPTPHDVNPAGFTIHSAVHMGRPDAGCVLHTHRRRRGRVLAGLRPATGEPMGAAVLQPRRLSRLRRHRAGSGRTRAAGGRPGPTERHDPAQPRPADRRRHRGRGLHPDAQPGPRLPRAAGDPVHRPGDLPGQRAGQREDRAPVRQRRHQPPARLARPQRTRMARAAQAGGTSAARPRLADALDGSALRA